MPYFVSVLLYLNDDHLPASPAIGLARLSTPFSVGACRLTNHNLKSLGYFKHHTI
jgi:hypothetical protein